MKKLISVLLAVLMLASLGTAAFAEEDRGITADMVLEWLDQGEEEAETVMGQAGNGALRLAEMVVALTNLDLASQEELDRAEAVLSALAEVDSPDTLDEVKLAAGTIKGFEALLLFANQVDREGKYDAYLDQIIDSYKDQEAAMDSGKGQAVNALYQSVRTVALIAEQHCPNQDAIDQIEAGLTEFAKGEDQTVTVDDQLANGAYWLCKMLSALAQLRDPDGSFTDQVKEQIADNQELADAQDNALQDAVIWLYGCVKMTGLLCNEAETVLAAS